MIILGKDSEKVAFTPSEHAIESLARCLYPAILEYFESEQGQKEFAEWKAQKQKEENLDQK